MKFLFFFWLLLIYSLQIAYSEIPEIMRIDAQKIAPEFDFVPCGHSNYKTNFNEKLQVSINDSYDVLEYNLYLDWSVALSGKPDTIVSHHYNGIQNIKIKSMKSELSQISLDAGFFQINNVSLNGKVLNNFTQPADFRFLVTFPEPLDSNEIFNLTIDYTNISNENIGFYIFPKGEIPWGDGTVNNLEKLACTFSEPELARFWMPCNDTPNDKAFSSISIKVPSAFNVASNGLLDSVITENNSQEGYKIYYWSDKKAPISTYLMSVTASIYKLYQDNYIRFNNPKDTVPIYNFVWESDYLGSFANGDSYDAISTFKNTPQILSAFSDLFGEYQFDKYGHAAIQPFTFGGMEHQTITTVNRVWMAYNSELGIAHEIAHHWIGDLITCESWQDIWINEGGATWFEAMWIYYQLLPKGNGVALEAYNKYFTDRAWRYLSDKNLYDKVLNLTPTNKIFTYTHLTYTKASWIFNMLFRRLGEDYLRFMKFLFNKHKFRNISSMDFKNDLVSYLDYNKIEFPAEEFFEQWVFGAGHPIYNTSLNFKGTDIDENYNYTLRLEQVQRDLAMRETFNNFIKIDFFVKSKLDTSIVLYNNSRIEDYILQLESQIDSIAIDKSYLLCSEWSNIVSVKNNDTQQHDWSVYPNPISKGNSLHINIPKKSGEISINIYDLLGNKYITDNFNCNLSNSQTYEVFLGKLPVGNYYILISYNNQSIVRRFVIIE